MATPMDHYKIFPDEIPISSGVVRSVADSRTHSISESISSMVAAVFNQKLRLIEARPASGIEWPTHTISVRLPGLYARDEDTPVMVGAVRERIKRYYARQPCVIFAIKEHQIRRRSYHANKH
jgi:hypothetical protein